MDAKGFEVQRTSDFFLFPESLRLLPNSITGNNLVVQDKIFEIFFFSWTFSKFKFGDNIHILEAIIFFCKEAKKLLHYVILGQRDEQRRPQSAALEPCHSVTAAGD